MKNDYFSIVLINQKTKDNFSITLSRWTLRFIVFCFFSLIIALLILSYHRYIQHPYRQQLSIIHNIVIEQSKKT